VNLMSSVIMSRALKRCRIMEQNSMSTNASMIHGFNYSDFEQILHCLFKKKRKHRP
jgi:hypothetical protein